MTQSALFDYQQLDTETRIVVQQRTSEIKTLMKRTAQDIIEIGQKLIEVKERLPHGAFGGWLEAEFNWTDRTARKYMAIAKTFKTEEVFRFESIGFDTLALLASPSTPEEARQEAIERAERGEAVTYSAAREIVNEYKPQPDGRGSEPAITFESSAPLFTPDEQLDAALDDPQSFVCSECGEVLEVEAWHCNECNRHWPVEKTRCPICSFNYYRDNRRSVASDIYTPLGMDACQTPAYAIDPLLPHIRSDWLIWEPAQGERNLVEAFYDAARYVVGSDILDGQSFFEYEPDSWDCLVTNPPYSIQFLWLERCYQLGKPFALLLKVEVLGTKTVQELIQQYGFEMMLLDRRIDFKMPLLGWGDGDRKSSATFPVFWLCWQVLPEKVMFGKINK